MKKLFICILLSSLTTTGVQACQAPPSIFDIIYNTYKAFVPEIKKDPKAEFEKFRTKYAPPQEISNMLEKHQKEIATKYRNLWAGVFSIEENNKKVFIKFGASDLYGSNKNVDDFALDRVINAVRLRNYIKHHKLNIIVPNKYFYMLDGIGICIAEDIGTSTDRPFSLEEIQELVRLVEGTSYTDCHSGNIIRNADEIMAIVDTEDGAFNWGRPLATNAASVIHLSGQKDANAWLLAQSKPTILHTLRISLRNYLRNNHHLPGSSNFDDPDINFELVKQEYRRLCDVRVAKELRTWQQQWNTDRVQEA